MELSTASSETRERLMLDLHMRTYASTGRLAALPILPLTPLLSSLISSWTTTLYAKPSERRRRMSSSMRASMTSTHKSWQQLQYSSESFNDHFPPPQTQFLYLGSLPVLLLLLREKESPADWQPRNPNSGVGRSHPRPARASRGPHRCGAQPVGGSSAGKVREEERGLWGYLLAAVSKACAHKYSSTRTCSRPLVTARL